MSTPFVTVESLVFFCLLARSVTEHKAGLICTSSDCSLYPQILLASEPRPFFANRSMIWKVNTIAVANCYREACTQKTDCVANFANIILKLLIFIKEQLNIYKLFMAMEVQ